jgi:hypothetical protein
VPEWLQANQSALWWLGALSVVTFVGSLIAIPILVARIPADYFAPKQRDRVPWRQSNPVLHGCGLILKNLAGSVFVVAGLAMLVLPGQGILTILIGVMLMDFPGKFALERWLVRKKTVLRAINWIRAKAGQPALLAPDRNSAVRGHPANPGSF